MDTTVPILIGLCAAMFLSLGAILDDRRARFKRRAHREELESALPLLHSINDDRCIGCEACVDVCPTEVLDLVDHKVRVARFSDCVQCEQCANACPTQALVMYREGTTPRMLTVPELDDHFQTAVPGQYLIGEIAGKPLVKNAANLGRAVIEHIARDLHGKPAPGGGVLDVVIVGSGPGGLSAGLTCIVRKLSCVVLEKEHIISSTVSRYPKGKHFMAEPCSSNNVSFLPVFDGSKEQLVDAWKKVVDGARLPIKLGEAVETVARGDDGVFTVKTTVGTYRARTVVLATGLRGKPRLLAVPGANLEKVQSLLDDPAEFAGQHVLVVGGGDSAVEGAMSLVDVGATVTLSYRGDGFKRCKQGNQKRLAELTASRKLDVLLESNVSCFTPDAVTIKLKSGTETTIPNQHAFVLIGADTPVAWLEANNVRFVERPHLYALGSTDEVVRRYAPDAVECSRTPDEALAVILDRPVHKPGRRMMSVVGHIRDEFRDIATSVSQAFRLSDLEPPRETRRAGVRTPPRGMPRLPTSKTIVSATRLYAQRPASVVPDVEWSDPEPTLIGPTPLKPTSPRRAPTEGSRRARTANIDFTTAEVTSLRELEKAATDIEMTSLRVLEQGKPTSTKATLPLTSIAPTRKSAPPAKPNPNDTKATVPAIAIAGPTNATVPSRAIGFDTVPQPTLPDAEPGAPIVRFKQPAPATPIGRIRPPSPAPAAARAKPPSAPPPLPRAKPASVPPPVPRAKSPSAPPPGSFEKSPWNAPPSEEIDRAFLMMGGDKMSARPTPPPPRPLGTNAGTKATRASQPVVKPPAHEDFEEESATVIVSDFEDESATVLSSARPR